MSSTDAVMWDIERDPILRSTITAVALLDRSPDWDRLRERLRDGAAEIPRLRQRVVVPPLRLGPPRWVADSDFDLDYHLRRVRSPEPGSLRSVLDLAAPIAMDNFDHARPLWEFTLVEGLADGRAALIQKIHHSVTDGVGGIRLALLLLDETREGPSARPVVELPSADHGLGLSDALDGPRSAIDAVRHLPGQLGRGIRAAITDPVRTAREAARYAGSLVMVLRPVTRPASTLMVGRSLGRRFEMLDVALADLEAAGHLSGGTVNDAFLAAVIGGLDRYHRAHGASVEELRVTMPVNFRGDDDPLGGNRFAPARFAVPVVADPLERMHVLGERARAWRREPALATAGPIAAVLDRLPVVVTTEILGGMLKAIDVVATNVPGVADTVYLAGAEVLREYAFAPPSGAALSVALLSHGGTACIGVVLDTLALPDADGLVRSLAEGFDEVTQVVAQHEILNEEA